MTDAASNEDVVREPTDKAPIGKPLKTARPTCIRCQSLGVEPAGETIAGETVYWCQPCGARFLLPT